MKVLEGKETILFILQIIVSANELTGIGKNKQ